METFLTSINADDLPGFTKLFQTDPELAMRPVDRARLYDSKILHWLYAGDTALHLAAAGHRDLMVRAMLKGGANPNVVGTHRHGRPLHYASDGAVGHPSWHPQDQVKTIRVLLDAGADLHAVDKNGATPLHRAVRTRSADAVDCLLKAGADPTRRNLSGSTPFHLAVQSTGRGGSGSEAALAGQKQILRSFLAIGASLQLKDGKGKSVLESARSEWIRELLRG